MKDWRVWALLIGLYLVVKMCGGCDGCNGCGSDESSSDSYEQSSSSSDSEERAPSWIQGKWICVSPYGVHQVEIVGDHIREFPGDGSYYEGTYHISGNRIIADTGSGIGYDMDKSTQRLSAGFGYYLEKR